FFFSSRRRHTRFSRDWSSDVCSSDLASQEQVISELALAMSRVTGLSLPQPVATTAFFWSQARPAEQLKWGALAAPRLSLYVCGRSEERRVGKEGRLGWWA